MSNPVASVVTPLDKNESLVFSVVGEKRQLTMAYHPLHKKGPTVADTDNGVVIGSIATPGGLSAVIRRGLVTVYGLTKLASGEVNTVSQLAPYPNPLSKEADFNTTYAGFAAVSNDADERTPADDWVDTAWLYFIKKEKEGSVSPRLQEVVLVRGEPAEGKTLELPVTEKTRVAALYLPDTKQRMLFYQAETDEALKGISVVTIDPIKGRGTAVPVAGTNNAITGTPLAVSYDIKEGVRTLYLYYVIETKEVYRTTLRTGETEWSSPTVLKHAIIAPGSQLTATRDAKHNHVFWIENATPKKGYLNHLDPLL